MAYTKICLFCDELIANNMITCRKHIYLWKEYKHTTWAQEFKVMQDKQNSITKMECEQENHDIPHNKVIRIGGKSEYKRGNKAKILEMWNDGNGKTRNEIIKELELPRGTVIKIIWQYNKSKKT